MLKRITTYLFSSLLLKSLPVAVLTLCVLTACEDDTFNDYNGRIPDGTTSVYLDFNFEPLSAASLNSRAGAEHGEALKPLRDFSILFYDQKEGSENPTFRFDFTPEVLKEVLAGTRTDITISEEERSDSDASNGHKAESKTTRVKLRLDNIRYGRYRIYAVANLGGNSDDSPSTTKDVLDNSDISTHDKLQFCYATWDSDNILNNAQMTGFFTRNQQASPSTSTQVQDVIIDEPNITIHSWLRRLASKLTIDFDPSRMRNDITVTIKKVTVRDIASSCFYGAPNKVGVKEDLIDDGRNPKIEYEVPIVLTNKESRYPRKPEDPDYPHTETAPALYFFENMQGDVEDKDTNGKYQDGDGNGTIDYPFANDSTHTDYKDHKDGLVYGTYVEVEAEYESKAQNNLGQGKIKYRFMIGKDTEKNCDAERNHHFKLTLCFLGNANEVDWHIEYEENPGFYGPNPYYVSYLYNQSTLYPIKIAGTVDQPVTMTILKNDWSPYNAPDLTYYANPKNDPSVTDKDMTFSPQYVWNTERDNNDHIKNPNLYAPWLGFLSFAEDLKNSNIGIGLGIHDTYLYDYWNGNDNSKNVGDNVMVKRGVRTFRTDVAGTFSDGLYSSNGSAYSGSVGEEYRVEKNPGSVTIHVPFFTRQKQLVKTMGFTGNNPYVAYKRQAKVRIDYSTKETGDRSEVIDVYQVKRIVNPKGVWRRHNNAAPFDVTLMEQEAEASTEFTPAKSEGGPWRAYVWRGNTNFITLDGKTEVRGAKDSEMSFRIGFKGTISSDQTRCAIIRVDYNNYSCHHLIFVRQGYAPIQLLSGDVKWRTSNVVETSKDASGKITVTEAATPTDEGSMFRYGNLEKGISALDNAAPSVGFVRSNATPASFDPSYNPNPYFQNSGVSWNNIAFQPFSGDGNIGFPDVTLNGKTLKVADEDDYKSLMDNINLDYGYGVLYGDDATVTATNIDEAYGYCTAAGHTSGYGMRGVFVYNQSATTATFGGNNLFFPIGRAGFGHRKHSGEPWPGAGNRCLNGSNGVLQYASRANWYGNVTYGFSDTQKKVPLFYDLFRSNGAIYWLKKAEQRGQGSAFVLDINYQTMDFSIGDDGISWGNNGGSDAGFVRLVEKENK